MAKKKEAPAKKPARSKTGKKAAKKSPVKASPKKAVKKAVATKSKTAKASSTKKTPAKKIVAKPAQGPAEKLADAVVEGILEVKGRNISQLDLRGIHNRVCDYFIICQADSNTQVKAIAGSVEDIVRKRTGEKPYRSEGFENSEWILVDYVTVVVHIFQSQIRNFYNLESLWADAEVKEIAFD